jgi:hypothetical protein
MRMEPREKRLGRQQQEKRQQIKRTNGATMRKRSRFQMTT